MGADERSFLNTAAPPLKNKPQSIATRRSWRAFLICFVLSAFICVHLRFKSGNKNAPDDESEARAFILGEDKR